MKIDGIRFVLSKLMGRPVEVSPHSDGSQSLSSCPLATWRHKNGTDHSPSCSFSVNEEDETLYYCFGCHASGTLRMLVEDFENYSETDLTELKKWIDDNEKGRDRPIEDRIADLDWEKFQNKHSFHNDEEVWDEQEVSPYTGMVPEYIIDRGITGEVCKLFDLGFDVNESRLIFPIRRMRDSKLVGIVGRTVLTGGSPKYKNYWNFKKTQYLYGENLAQKGEDVIVVEGMIDVLKMWSLGFRNTVGLFGSRCSETQAKKLIELGEDSSVILMFDGDEAGKTGADRTEKNLLNRVMVRRVNLPEGRDPGDLSQEEANELLSTAKLVL